MSFEDQFTSIQLDKDERVKQVNQLTIDEEGSSDLLAPHDDGGNTNASEDATQQPLVVDGDHGLLNNDSHPVVPVQSQETAASVKAISDVAPPDTTSMASHSDSNDTVRSIKSNPETLPGSVSGKSHDTGKTAHDSATSAGYDSGKSPVYEPPTAPHYDSPNKPYDPNPTTYDSKATTSEYTGAARYQPVFIDRSDFDNYRIESVISSPIRDVDTNSKPYISYLLTTTTNNPKLLKLSQKSLEENQQYVTIQTRRRYGDFRYLHESLSKDFPTIMIPPLPSKSNFKYLTGDTFSSEFVHKRLNSLNRFIQFIVSHKILSQASIYHLFLSDSADWATFTKSLKIKDSDDAANSGLVNKVVNEEFKETVMNLLTPSKHKRETNKDILEINDKLKKLYENLLKLDKLFSKLNRKNHDLSVDYDHFSKQIVKLAQVQKEENGNSETTDTDIKPDDAIVNNFKIFAESLSYFLKNWATVHTYIDESFLVSLKDCSRYIVSLTNLIELEHNNKIDLQVLQDYLAKSKNELAMLGEGDHRPPPVPVGYNNSGIVNTTTQLIKDTLSTSATATIGSSTTDNKIDKLHRKIAQLEQEIESQTKLVNDLTNNIVNEEYPDWNKFNRNELKNSMVGLCDEQIKFYKGLINNWNEVELKLVKRLDELK